MVVLIVALALVACCVLTVGLGMVAQHWVRQERKLVLAALRESRLDAVRLERALYERRVPRAGAEPLHRSPFTF